MPDGSCSSCNFYNPFTGVCSNSLSRYRGQYMPPIEVCDEFTAINEEDDYAPDPA